MRHLVTLIIRQSHLDLNHGTIKETLMDLRVKYWILSARKLVVNYIKNVRCAANWMAHHLSHKKLVSYHLFELIRVFHSRILVWTMPDCYGEASEMYNVHVVLFTIGSST